MGNFRLSIHRDPVGHVEMDEPSVGQLSPKRTAAGFEIGIPGKVRLNWDEQNDRFPMLLDLRAELEAKGRGLDLGPATTHQQFQAARPYNELPLVLKWRSTLGALASYERTRDGSPVELSIRLWAQLAWVEIVGGKRVLTEPFQDAGTAHVRWPRETWIDVLQKLNLSETVLVEMPVPTDPGNPWEPVWKGFRDARSYFAAGGPEGWKGCVTSVRLALEKWATIETPDHGPGWKAPPPTDREARSRKQRLDNLRWHLHQCAHEGPHTPTDDWTRRDAAVLLATLAGLLGQRHP